MLLPLLSELQDNANALDMFTNTAKDGPVSLGNRGVHVTCDYLYLMQIILSPGNTTVLVCFTSSST